MPYTKTIVVASAVLLFFSLPFIGQWDIPFIGNWGRPVGVGDPDNRLLSELSYDPVFASVPPSATDIHVERTPAQYHPSGFDPGGWRWPRVSVTFNSSAPRAEIYEFYARQTGATGWHPVKEDFYKRTFLWGKTYPGGANANLVLLTFSPKSIAYKLDGSIEPGAVR